MVRILAARFPVADPAALRPFYTDTLGLPLLDERAGQFSVRAGASRLTFVAAPGPPSVHHLAFNIPRDALPAAKAWLAARVPLLTQDGADEFDFHAWRARALYFRDLAGNILELIARQALPAAGAAPFGPAQILSVGEVGLPVAAVPATVAALGRDLALPPYLDGEDTFAPVGDEAGLLIVVRAGRHWFPTADAATAAPIAVTLAGDHARDYALPGTPHTLTLMGDDGRKDATGDTETQRGTGEKG
jgi:catechol 2,3-dioxygenase-like lactoylglutathione lyase family enzyme